jgi:hypothetical protein
LPGAEVGLQSLFIDPKTFADAGGYWEHKVELSRGNNQFLFFLQDDQDVYERVCIIYEPLPTSTP